MRAAITITITGQIWPDYYYYYYSGILRSLLLLLLRYKSVITITITISNSLTTLLSSNCCIQDKVWTYMKYVNNS